VAEIAAAVLTPLKGSYAYRDGGAAPCGLHRVAAADIRPRRPRHAVPVLANPRARMAVGDAIAAIADFLPRARKPRQWRACGSERPTVGRTPAAIAVEVPEPALVNRSSGGCRDDAHRQVASLRS
jgi:hypothetical protein